VIRLMDDVLTGGVMKQSTTMSAKITACPTCGSPKFRRVRKTVKRTHAGQTYVVPNLAFWECPACGERVYDRDAMRRIESHSPAYHKPRRTAAR
jgi:YgiT-type zinc finger domain-containing protein